MLSLDFGERESLLVAIEETYSGNWEGMDHLLRTLSDSDVRWRRAAFDALRFAAERTFGYDPEADPNKTQEARQRWRAWAQRNQRRLIGAR